MAGGHAAENRERQENEVALLESMYPDELEIIKQPKGLDEEFELEIHLDPAHSLSFVLSPRTYPASSAPQVFLSFGSDVPNDTRKCLRARLREIVEQQEPGIECVDLIIGDFRQTLDDMSAAADDSSSHNVDQNPNPHAAETEGLRVVLWMHHLLATSKRRAIVQLSKELGLGGFSKPGYPGSVYVEGEAAAVRTFVDELKSMRWQAIQERATENAQMSSLTLAPGIQEVQGLGDIAERLKSSGNQGERLATFFLGSMKII
ncbi:hypothetical protein SLS56_000327 [Neofusicoccum ribis]|uniref:RWD domain-containing protein n=1 Tax=Neofusicoccum ribis TaxID=45134 RepID=A0ABR3TE30_9PEZI